jgi:hypothetical protein
MDIIKVSQKGKNFDILERFYIYKATRSKIILNEQHVIDPNVLFDVIIDKDKDMPISRNDGITDYQ